MKQHASSVIRAPSLLSFYIIHIASGLTTHTGTTTHHSGQQTHKMLSMNIGLRVCMLVTEN